MTIASVRYSSILAAVVTALTPGDSVEGQVSPPPATPGSTVTVVAGPDYEAGLLKRKLLGNGWRDLWTTPVRVPVLDLSTYAGGLKIIERGGGMQTFSLHMQEVNGWREHHFRSVNKFPLAQAMPPAVRGVLAGDIIEDQTSGLMPAGALLLPPLLRAVGVLHINPELYVMPNDPRLGTFRDTFATMLGTVELSPQEAPNSEPGFAGSRHIEGAIDFLKTIETSRAHRVDERELFAVRLVDFLVNDTDRGADNSRFARFGPEGHYVWRPIPRDRDRAFTDQRGWLTKFVLRPVYPKLVAFTPEYNLEGLVFTGHEIDRRLLQRITRTDADEIALRVQRAVTNDVIEQVIAALPAEWKRTSAPERLRSVLRVRRDNLPGIASEFYSWLATEVDIHGSDEDDRAEIERHDDGRVTVTIAGREDSAGVQPYSRRTFLPGETNEVRVYMHGGKDEAVVKGSSNGAITVRVIGGGGDDRMEDDAGGTKTRFYDSDGDNSFETKPGTRVDFQQWHEPKEGAGIRFDSPWRPDWGGSSGWGPAVEYAHGAGLIIGYGPRYETYGFRRLPHRIKASANALLGLGNMRPGLKADVDYRAENSPLALILNMRATRFEVFSFSGFGNDTPLADEDARSVDQDLIAVEPKLLWQIGYRSREGFGGTLNLNDHPIPGLRPLIGNLEAGPVIYWTDADSRPGSPFAEETALRGDTEGRAGVRIGLDLDRTPAQAVPDRGWRLDSEFTGFPGVWNLKESFSTAAVSLATYVPLPGVGAHVALRAGGAIASGAFPVLHAPAIGGRHTVRGYTWRRFTGDQTAFGSAELRVPVGVFPFILKWNTGVFGLMDAGRVWFERESPGGWHTSVGGGLWFSSLGQTFSVSYARGDSGRFYVQKGVSF